MDLVDKYFTFKNSQDKEHFIREIKDRFPGLYRSTNRDVCIKEAEALALRIGEGRYIPEGVYYIGYLSNKPDFETTVYKPGMLAGYGDNASCGDVKSAYPNTKSKLNAIYGEKGVKNMNTTKKQTSVFDIVEREERKAFNKLQGEIKSGFDKFMLDTYAGKLVQKFIKELKDINKDYVFDWSSILQIGMLTSVELGEYKELQAKCDAKVVKHHEKFETIFALLNATQTYEQRMEVLSKYGIIEEA